MTAVKCAAEGYFVDQYYRSCESAERCVSSSNSSSYYVYTAAAECTNIKPDENGGFANVTGKIYSCPEASPYIDLSGPAKCVSAEACTARGYTLDVSPFRECVTFYKCKSRGYFVHKATRRCLALEDCLALKPSHYAYTTLGECSEMEPDTGSGSGLQKASGNETYGCSSSSSYIDRRGNKTLCVNESDCRKLGFDFSE